MFLAHIIFFDRSFGEELLYHFNTEVAPCDYTNIFNFQRSSKELFLEFIAYILISLSNFLYNKVCLQKFILLGTVISVT